MNTPRKYSIIPKYIALFLIGMFIAAPAQAYIDPGTGSYLLQIIFGLVMALIVFPKTLFRKVLFWRRKDGSKNPESNKDANKEQ